MKFLNKFAESIKRKQNILRLYYSWMRIGIYTPYEFCLILLGVVLKNAGLKLISRELDGVRLLVKKRKKMYLAKDCYMLKDVKIPLLDTSDEKVFFTSVLNDTFYSYLYLEDNYDVHDIAFIDEGIRGEGFYIYSDRTREINLRLRPDDVVIDAGAWIGDFSAYASVYGTRVYAFEPVPDTFEILQETACLNRGIIPVNMGLGAQKEEISMSMDTPCSSSACMCKQVDFDISVKVNITTLDDFVEEHKLDRVDFIKADIEGHERFMLQGAKNVLKNFGPRMALCTYHLPDDPQVLESIIKEINPAYEVIQGRCKLYAYIP